MAYQKVQRPQKRGPKPKVKNEQVVPSGQPVPQSTSQTPQGTSSLQEAIAESERAIASSTGVKRAPRGETKPASPVGNTEAPKTEPLKEAAPNIVPLSFLEKAVNLPGQALAAKTNWQNWELSEQEKKDNAILLDLCCKQYLPQLESQHAALIGLALGLGMAYGSRYLAYKAYLSTLAPRPAQPGDRNANSETPNEIHHPKAGETKIADAPSEALNSIFENKLL